MVVDLKMLAMIFIINFAYITLNTIRFMLTMKGYRVIAPLVSMAEITIYVLGLSMVLNRLDNPLNLLVYALGYAVGISRREDNRYHNITQGQIVFDFNSYTNANSVTKRINK